VYSSTLFLTSTIDGGGWSTPLTSRLTLWNDPLPIVQEAGEGSSAGLNGCGKCRPYRDSISGPSSPYLVAIPTELSRPSALSLCFINLAR
jgi:hypothetical protein